MYTVRPATIDDAPAIAAFNLAMAKETEGKALDPATLDRGVRRAFEQPGHGRYLVAESNAEAAEGQVVGCLLVTYEWSDWRGGQIWWVQSVYVDPDHRRRGVFTQLYQAVRELGEQAGGVCGYRLYVEQDNNRAQAIYAKLGMSRTAYLLYEDMR